jgi:hypothetical protein
VVELPAGARLREEHQVSADAQDWAVLLEAYAREHLLASQEREDERLLTAVREVLPSLGYLLTVRGLRSTTSPVDRICALSAAKTAAAVHVLAAESAALGEDLRAVVLCDYEQRTASRRPRWPRRPRTGRPAPRGWPSWPSPAATWGPACDRCWYRPHGGRTRADFRAFRPSALGAHRPADHRPDGW